MGHEIDRARIDLDGDGHISLAEAHAYAQINGESVDIPMCTSDDFLRRVVVSDNAGVLKDWNYARLRAKATRPTQAAVLDGLAVQLKLAERKADLLQSVRELDNADAAEMRRQNDRRKRVSHSYDRARDELRGMLESKWPELSSPWHPRVGEILREHSDEIVKAIEAHPGYQRITKTGQELDAIDEMEDKLEIEHAKCQRFLRTLESVALEQRLPEERRGEFEQLIKAENVYLQ